MVKRITVSVDDGLAAKIERWKSSGKGEGKISLSKKVQMAIGKAISDMEKEIEEKEQFNKRLKEDVTMEATILRLRREKAEQDNVYYDRGKAEGLRWVKAANYRNLHYAAEIFQPYSHPPSPFGEFEVDRVYCDAFLGDYFRECLEGDPATTTGGGDDYFPKAGDSWIKGWLEAICGCLTEVSSKQ